MTLPVPLLMGVGILLLLLIVPRAVEWDIKVTAIENAHEFVKDFRSIRDYYSQYVVREAIQSEDLTVTHRHRESEASIPVPATFLKEMTRQRGDESIAISLYSPFPFASENPQVLDAFQQEAWDRLNRDPDGIVTRIEEVDGEAFVRVAMADRMASETCVACHNSHPESPRHDWAVGDVRGVIEVRSNVEAQFARGTKLSIGLIVMLSLGGLVLAVVNGLNARAVAKPLRGMSSALHNLASGNRDFQLPTPEKSDEVRQLWEAFQAFRSHDEERERLSQQVHELAYFDSLTTLPNRASFRERLEQEIKRATDNPGLLITVMLLDLDRFRDVNNTLGHQAGDWLLKKLGERLSRLEGHHSIVARMSEDEFGILVCQEGDMAAQQETALASIRKIINAVEEPMEWEDHQLNLSGSIGIAIYPKDGMTFGALLKHADLALYQAKEEGRRTYRYYSKDLELEVARRVQMTRDLRQALDNDELYPCFQPQYDIKSRRIVGAEMLLRWQRPDGSGVSPGEFIPVAEQSGLIVPIGRRFLRKACELSAAWQEAGIAPIRMAVNVSAIEFDQPDFVQSIETVLMETGLDPRLLEVELTESATMNEINLVIEIMTRLQDLGIELAVDDFGTGYSSLSYLKRLPIGRLKIDQSFVRHMIQDSDDATIVHTVINLAKNLGLQVIAEGVEDEKTLTYLLEEGCDEAQGFFFSRPLPAEDFLALLVEQQAGAGIAS